MAKAGKFEIDIRGPYPVWLELWCENNDFSIKFDHRDLRDLKHVVDAAVREAGARLTASEAKQYGLDMPT